MEDNKVEKKEVIQNDWIFSGFEEFWSLTRGLEDFQRKIICSVLCDEEKDAIKAAYKDEGWEDLLMRNRLDEAIDQIKNDIGIDMLAIKSKITHGKSVYIKKSQWDYANEIIKSVANKEKHLRYITGGIKEINEGHNTVCLAPY